MTQLPTLLWRGPKRYTRTRFGEFDRHTPVEVSQEWLDERRAFFPPPHWEILPDGAAPKKEAATPVKEGLPTKDWLKKDIVDWLSERGVEAGMASTKRTLLAKVDEALTTPGNESGTEE